MLKNFVATTTENSDVTVCSAGAGTELSVMSIIINGGENGGDITLNFSTGFSMGFTISAEDSITLDDKINLPTGESFSVNANATGIRVMVSAAELAV